MAIIPPLTIVGAGSIGSIAALLLALMGRTLPLRITICDFDKVEERNRINQIYREEDVGTTENPVFKVDALKRILGTLSRVEVHAICEKVMEDTALSGAVVVAVDSMSAREIIFSAVRYNAWVPLFIDARSGGKRAIVYALDPRDPDDVRAYEETLYSDAEASPAPCADPLTIPILFHIAAVIAEILALFFREGTAKFNEALINTEPLPTINNSTTWRR